jgi:hypothetical protein
MLTMLALSTSSGLGLEGTEDQIKSAMMVNFIKFIQWPESVTQETGGLITIGVFCNDHFEQALEPVQGRTVGSYRIAVRRITDLDQMTGCQVLYICSSETHRIDQIFSWVYRRPILTIGEDENFLRSGGIIRFYMEKKHIRFEINKTAALGSNLQISAKLIEIAEVFE